MNQVCALCGEPLNPDEESPCEACRNDSYDMGFRTYEEWVEEGGKPTEL
jgi:hypothetical protein